jgi:protein-S-isoprenylcysteine O-methyltransferase Ste14
MKGFVDGIIDLIHKGATSSTKIRIILTPLVGTGFLVILLLAILVSFYLDRLLGFPEFLSRPYSIFISIPFLLVGSSVWIWCAWRFLKAKGTPVPINPPQKLITDGPYAYTRNPMMTGVFMMLAGIGILFQSVSLTFITTPMVVFISILEFKYIEEPELERRFGKEYREYKERTPRIISKLS